MSDRVVTGFGGTPLAVRDFGGDGTPVVLLPGAGRTLVDLTLLARELVTDHRVVAADLRNHGVSGDGPWTWDAIVGDVRAVIDATGLQRPVIGGHSLGGMIAAMCGEAFDDCTAAVNLDGHGTGTPDRYVGLDTEVVTAGLARLREQAETMLARRAELTADEVAAERPATIAQLTALGMPEPLAQQAFERSLGDGSDGVRRPRPAGQPALEMMAALEELDLPALYRRVRCPLLIYNAVADLPAAGDPPAWLVELMAAARRGLADELAALAAECPNVQVETVDATHGLIVEQPRVIADRIRAFVGAAS